MSTNVLNKKGMTLAVTVALALITLIVIILIPFYMKITEEAKQRAADTECKQSVIQAAQTKEAWKYKTGWSDIINCPTNYFTINTEDNYNKQIADELTNCWWKMGEGKLELFKQESAVFCVVCSVIEFQGDKEVIGLKEYIKNTNMPGKKITYQEYLMGTEASNLEFKSTNEFNTTSKINKAKPHAIVYVHGKQAEEWSTEYQAWRIMKGEGVGPLVKYGISYLFGWDVTSQWNARVALIPYTEEALGQELGCEVLQD